MLIWYQQGPSSPGTGRDQKAVEPVGQNSTFKPLTGSTRASLIIFNMGLHTYAHSSSPVPLALLLANLLNIPNVFCSSWYKTQLLTWNSFIEPKSFIQHLLCTM